MGCRRTWSVGSSAAGTRSKPPVVPAAARRRVGLPVGGRHLQRTSRRPRAAVRAGGHWRERPRREALPGHRGRRARVHPELARGAAGDEAARLHSPGEAGRGRRGAGVLGGAVGSVSSDPNAALLDAQDREPPELPPEVWPGEGQAGTARDLGWAETKAQAERAFDDWLQRYDDKYPKATALPGSRPRPKLLASTTSPLPLDAPSNDQRHRVGLRNDPTPQLASQGLRHTPDHAVDDLQNGPVRREILRRLRGFRQLAKVIQGVRSTTE